MTRDAEKVEQLVADALDKLRDAAAFEEAISDKDKAPDLSRSPLSSKNPQLSL